MYTIKHLLENSNLPGPRGNLELLYDFSKNANDKIVDQCLLYILDHTSNSPEEFVGMCGILGYSVLHSDSNEGVLTFLQKYASHKSWRIREAVAMGIQEISENNMGKTIENLKNMADGNPYEQRAVVAGLCEPKLLSDRSINKKILKILSKITKRLDHNNKLSESEDSLRKALGYGWSVVIVHIPEEGKLAFENMSSLTGKHIRWIIKENLKKNRLIKMDKEWVIEMGNHLTTGSN